MIEIVVGVAILSIFFIFVFYGMGNAYKIDIISESAYSESNEGYDDIHNSVTRDIDSTDGIAPNDDLVDVYTNNLTISDTDIPYELFVANGDNKYQDLEVFTYNIQNNKKGPGDIFSEIDYFWNTEASMNSVMRPYTANNSYNIDWDDLLNYEYRPTFAIDIGYDIYDDIDLIQEYIDYNHNIIALNTGHYLANVEMKDEDITLNNKDKDIFLIANSWDFEDCTFKVEGDGDIYLYAKADGSIDKPFDIKHSLKDDGRSKVGYSDITFITDSQKNSSLELLNHDVEFYGHFYLPNSGISIDMHPNNYLKGGIVCEESRLTFKRSQLPNDETQKRSEWKGEEKYIFND